MYLLYVDESGGPNSWKIQDHFVVGGIAVHEGQVRRLALEVDAIQKEYFPDISIPLPFHVTDIREGIDRYRRFSREKREELIGKLYRIIADIGMPHVVVFAAAISVDSVKDSTQVIHDTFEEVCSTFNDFLRFEYRLNIKTKGLLIIDENRVTQKDYRKLLENFQQEGSKYGYVGNVVDIPYFAKSDETRMLQLADFVANAVFRYYEKKEDKYLRMIRHCICRKPTDQQMYGLKHITKNKNCTCLACLPC